VRRMVHEVLVRGWVAVVYNRRGHRDRTGVRTSVQAAVDATIGELECDVASPRTTDNLLDANGSPAELPTGNVAGKARRKVWPMYSDLEDMSEVAFLSALVIVLSSGIRLQLRALCI
jgi:hypothetical protein